MLLTQLKTLKEKFDSATNEEKLIIYYAILSLEPAFLKAFMDLDSDELISDISLNYYYAVLERAKNIVFENPNFNNGGCEYDR